MLTRTAALASIGIGIGISTKALYDRWRQRITLIRPTTVETASTDRAMLAYEEMGVFLDRYKSISTHDVLAIATRWSTTEEEVDKFYEFLSTYLIP